AVDFAGASNPIVRVDARRLRDKLREYYADAAADPIVISLPKGSYVPAFALNADTIPARGQSPAAAEDPPQVVSQSPPSPAIAPEAARRRVSVWRGAVL